MNPTPPAFIAFTGADDPQLIDAMRALSRRYPIEWGVLLDEERAPGPPFADAATRGALLRSEGLRLAVHVCGAAARRIVEEGEAAGFDPAGFARVQINHGFAGSSAAQVRAAVRFARRHGLRGVLQCQGDFPADTGVDWLFDVSFGTGQAPGGWPPLPPDGPFCGYSGGIGPHNVRAVLQRIAAPPGALYWIDMESGVRRGGRFDLDQCEAVCRAVYG